MISSAPNDGVPCYARDLLLSSAKRIRIIELWEVEKFGRAGFGDSDTVSLYGVRSAEWHPRSIRILARTAPEAVRDPLEERIYRDVAGRRRGPAGSPTAWSIPSRLVQRPLLDSSTPAGRARDRFQAEPAVFEITTRNLASLGARIRLP